MAEPQAPAQTRLELLVDYLLDTVLGPKAKPIEDVFRNGTAQGQIIADAAIEKAKRDALKNAPEGIGLWTQLSEGVSAWIMSVVIESAFDVNVSQVDFARLGASGNRKAVAKAV
jgi:hypothetical protein